MRSTEELEKRIQYLEQENQYLKHLLSDAGISYSEKEIIENVYEYDPNQGARTIPREITETDAKVFFSMFWGARMYTANVPLRSRPNKSIIIPNVTIFGKAAVQELPEAR